MRKPERDPDWMFDLNRTQEELCVVTAADLSMRDYILNLPKSKEKDTTPPRYFRPFAPEEIPGSYNAS